MFGAGHNALGVWWWLAESGELELAEGSTVFHQEIGDRVLPVTISRTGGQLSGVVMEQDSPATGSRFDNRATLAAALALTAEEIALDRMPCQVVSTGAAHLMVWEDPATGTAAGPLAAHLVAHGLARPEQMITIEQGTAMGRTSLIQVGVFGNAVRLSGRGVVVASGQLML